MQPHLARWSITLCGNQQAVLDRRLVRLSCRSVKRVSALVGYRSVKRASGAPFNSMSRLTMMIVSQAVFDVCLGGRERE